LTPDRRYFLTIAQKITAMEITWEGVYPALTTPFTAQDEIDYPVFEKNLHAQMAAGVHGVILGGTLGEASSLLNEEKYDLVRFTVEKTASRIPVIMNIAEQTTRGAVAAAREAERCGASGLMLLPPMRYNADSRETLAYFRAVSDATPLPVMIYNNPVDYKIMVTLDMFAEMANWPTIRAVKESTRDVTNVTRMTNRFGDRFKILCGVDTLALESLLLGARMGCRTGGCLSGGDSGHLQYVQKWTGCRSCRTIPLVYAASGTRHTPQAGSVHQTGRGGHWTGY
jgi:4-hydroxy-tetrahydrodipicolinate synthase